VLQMQLVLLLLLQQQQQLVQVLEAPQPRLWQASKVRLMLHKNSQCLRHQGLPSLGILNRLHCITARGVDGCR
jgi:hypothetical protein